MTKQEMLNAVLDQQAQGAKPRVHGNGFIQLDMPNTNGRLHVWGDQRIPRQKVSTPIHDHVFSFESTVLVGKLLNVRYKIHDIGIANYKIYTASPRKGPDTVLADTGEQAFAYPSYFEMLSADVGLPNIYYMRAGDFHESIASWPAASLMRRLDPSPTFGLTKPRVLVPLGKEPDNEFRRDGFFEPLLWAIIFDTLGEMHDS